jgi:hypothetical protein
MDAALCLQGDAYQWGGVNRIQALIGVDYAVEFNQIGINIPCTDAE